MGSALTCARAIVCSRAIGKRSLSGMRSLPRCKLGGRSWYQNASALPWICAAAKSDHGAAARSTLTRCRTRQSDDAANRFTRCRCAVPWAEIAPTRASRQTRHTSHPCFAQPGSPGTRPACAGRCPHRHAALAPGAGRAAVWRTRGRSANRR